MAEQENAVPETEETDNTDDAVVQSESARPTSGGSRDPSERKGRGFSRAEGGRREQRTRPGRGRFNGRQRRGKVCRFCVDKVRAIDYKDISLLRQYLASSGRIRSRRKTGACARHQRMLSRAVKRARQIALLPYTAAHVRELRS